MAELPEIMSPAQVAEWLGCSDQHVRNLAKRGEMPGKKIGGLSRFSAVELIAWFNDQENATTS
jgi:excisionase family DNA binding protein